MDSTEDLQARLMALNSLPAMDREDMVIMSMNAASLFPSIQIERSGEAVREIIEESSIKLWGINGEELSRYLAVVLNDDEVQKHDLKQLVMVRKYRKGMKPRVTGTEINFSWREKEEQSSWLCAARAPNELELRKMLAVAVAWDVKRVMKCHVFGFRKKVYKQLEGGSIGSELTGIVAKVRMILWVRKINAKCLALGLRVLLSAVFVDDSVFAVKMIEKGMRYSVEQDTLQFSEEWKEEDETVCSDVRTARVLVAVANCLEDDIQMTFDTPSMNSNGCMPVLDLQLWCEGGQVFFSFFEKSCVSKYVLLKDSALSWTVKKMALAGEVARRMLNTSPQLVQCGFAEEEIEKFEYKMMISGYNLKERGVILAEGRARYSNLLSKVNSGERPLYRPSFWQKEERAVSKEIKRRRWYGDSDAVIFVQSTPGEILKKGIEGVMKGNNMNVKVVEKGGRTFKSILQRSAVQKKMRCEDPDCPVCLTEECGNCCRESIGYEIWCRECEKYGRRAFMHGETGRTARIRCGEHRDALVGKRGALWEHCVEFHDRKEVQFGYKVVGSFRDPLQRQLDEARRIEEECGILMNSKNEWVRPAGVRHTVKRM